MRNLESLTAERLLSINNPEVLFSNSLGEAKQEYKALALRWHPDRNSDDVAPKVFAHVACLYQAAKRKLVKGSWKEPAEKIEKETIGIKKFMLRDGSIKKVEYHAIRPFELGEMFISDHNVAFQVRDEFQDLFRNGLRQIQGIRYQDNDMAVEMSKFLPQLESAFRTADSCVLILRKTPDQLLLADVLARYGGKLMPAEHVGWILNFLYNLSCYLEWADTTHNAISPSTLFISPLRHSGVLLGGWWYAESVGAELCALPDYSLKFIPPDVIREKRADVRADLELVKAIGRAVLGDADGAQLILDDDLPLPIVEWLLMPSAGSATDDYAAWKYAVLPECFGPPKFVELKLESKDLYTEV